MERTSQKCQHSYCQNTVRPSKFNSTKYCDPCIAHQNAKNHSLKYNTLNTQQLNEDNNKYSQTPSRQYRQANYDQASGTILPINDQSKRPLSNRHDNISAYDTQYNRHTSSQFHPHAAQASSNIMLPTQREFYDTNNYDSAMFIKNCQLCGLRYQSRNQLTRICYACKQKNPSVYT